MSEAARGAQRASVDGRGNVVVQIEGDGNTVNVRGLAHLTLTRYLARRDRRPDASPLEVLHPYSYAIPRVGREPELAELWQWMQSDAPLSVRLIVGTGGAGKTRLALELCDQATERGWDAGLVTRQELERFWGAQNLATWGWQRPTLVVIDYAAAKAATLRGWLTELAGNLGDDRAPLRVLLLERHGSEATGWWHDVIGRGDADSDAVRRLCDPVAPVELPRLASAAERRTLFEGMLTLLGRSDLVASVADEAVERKLAEVTWGGEPLFLMMAAMTARDAGLATALALSSTEAAFKIADVELARIGKFAADARRARLLGHLAAYATLCQGLSRTEARQVIEAERRALGMTDAGDVATVLGELGDALPEPTGGVAAVLPDVVGEALAIRALGVGHASDATESVGRAAAWAEPRVAPVVIRAAQDHGAVDVTPLGWLDVLAARCGSDVDRLATLVRLLPEHTTVLREPAAELTQRIVGALVDGDERSDADRERRAGWLNDFSIRLSALGQREAALAAIEDAVAIRRELAAARPDAFHPGLAVSLNNLSNQLSDLGRREAALAASEDAVAIRRELAAARPDAFRPDLARSLNNLSIRLSDHGQREAALAAIEDAVAIRRELAAARPDAFRPDLAVSLNNLSNRLSDLGRREAALAAIEEAVAIWRELAAARPDAFRPDLALSLNNLSNRLSALGQREAALAAIEEAVAVWRELAAARPDAFRPNLARSLSNLSNRLSDLGRHEAALDAVTEAITLLRPHFLALPRAFAPWMRFMMRGYLTTTEQAGRSPERDLLEPIVAMLRQFEGEDAR